MSKPSPRPLSYKEGMPVYQFDPLTGFWGTPNIDTDVAFEGPSGPLVRVRHNSEGNRDEEVQEKPGVRNVLCYGGSHTWGAFVDQADRYTDVLNRRMRSTRFVNLGHGSFGLDQICLAILERSRRYSPSAVVIEQYPWAIHRVLNPYVQGYLKPSFYIDGSGALKLHKVPALARHKIFRQIQGQYRLYKKELAEFKGGVDIKNQYDPLADPIFLRWKTGYYEHMYLLVEKILQVIRDHSAQNKYKLVFLIIAYHQQFGQVSGSALVDFHLPAENFKAILRKLRIEYIDTAPALVAAHALEDPVIKPDGHTNARGHGVLAELLADGLTSRGWVKEAGHV